MISVPGSRLPPSAPRPQVAPEYLLMAQALAVQMSTPPLPVTTLPPEQK